MKKTGLRVLNLLEHDMLRHLLFILKVIFYSEGLEDVMINAFFFVSSLQPLQVAGVLRLRSELRLKADR